MAEVQYVAAFIIGGETVEKGRWRKQPMRVGERREGW